MYELYCKAEYSNGGHAQCLVSAIKYFSLAPLMGFFYSLVRHLNAERTIQIDSPIIHRV